MRRGRYPSEEYADGLPGGSFATLRTVASEPSAPESSATVLALERAAAPRRLPAGDDLAHDPDDLRVVLVDDDESIRGVLTALLRDEGYEVRTASGAAAGLELIEDHDPAVVLTDLKMPDHDGLWLLQRALERDPDVAVVLLTGFGQIDTAVEALRVGAADYLTKPVRLKQLTTSMERARERRRLRRDNRRYQRGLEQLVAEKTAELEAAYGQISDSYDLTLEALVTALDARECETSNHSQRVVNATLAIADRLGVEGEAREHIARGALLHDIGKIGVPDGVLLKPGRLDEDEWAEMRKHPEIGARILGGIEFLEAASEIVLTHQERWDGTGYPRGLAGTDIPLGARIFAVADALDAITSDRPYRRGRSVEYAREEIARYAGTQFDPDVVEAFLTISVEELNQIRERPTPFKARPKKPLRRK